MKSCLGAAAGAVTLAATIAVTVGLVKFGQAVAEFIVNFAK